MFLSCSKCLTQLLGKCLSALNSSYYLRPKVLLDYIIIIEFLERLWQRSLTEFVKVPTSFVKVAFTNKKNPPKIESLEKPQFVS